jgi:hypothetical protein
MAANLPQPGRPVGFCHHPGNLAIDIAAARQLEDIVLPRIQNPVPNARFSHVVEDEHLFRVTIYKLDRGRKVSLEDQDVIYETGVPHGLDTAIEVWAQ